MDLIFGYTGRMLNEATGLQNNLHRWYDARIGQFVSEDPIGFDGDLSNLYRYVGNRPTDRIDPSGLLTRTTGQGNSGNGIAAYNQIWRDFRLVERAPAECDVVLIQRIIVAARQELTDRAGRVTTPPNGLVSYYEILGAIKAGQSRLPLVNDTWAYPGDIQFERGQPQITYEQIIQTDFVIAHELTDDLKKELSTWQPGLRFPIGNTFWTSGSFRASRTFNSNDHVEYETEDQWHKLISTWTNPPQRNTLVVDGKST